MMTRVLLVGYDPETVDYSNLALPPGMSAERSCNRRGCRGEAAGAIAQDLMRGQVYNALWWCHATENTTMRRCNFGFSGQS